MVILNILSLLLLVLSVNGQLSEPERLVEYYKRNYTWPLDKFIPDTKGWSDLMKHRLDQVEHLSTSHDRYNGFMQTIHSAFLAPNFTELGFGLARCPNELINTLRKAIRDGLPTASEEESTEAINAPERPWLVHRPDLTQRVLHELKPFAEEWAGQKLVAWGAYGFRLYRNQSALYMHIDKMQTHVISFILHIDSSDDAEPWPIFIEDFNGTTHEVILTPGDMLFYESSKCFHGRPKRLNGSWYSSIFVHYYPTWWPDVDHDMEAHYAVPPIWSQKSDTVLDDPKLVMAGTSMKEPDCPYEWCPTTESKKWSGPGETGKWINPKFERLPLQASLEAEVRSRSDEL